MRTPGGFVKDLRVLGNRRLEDLVIVDNSVLSFAAQLANGIYVPSFDGSADDHELPVVANFLKSIAHVADVRPYVTKFAGLQALVH
jgi:CTD small phosphatase-like protein 2